MRVNSLIFGSVPWIRPLGSSRRTQGFHCRRARSMDFLDAHDIIFKLRCAFPRHVYSHQLSRFGARNGWNVPRFSPRLGLRPPSNDGGSEACVASAGEAHLSQLPQFPHMPYAAAAAAAVPSALAAAAAVSAAAQRIRQGVLQGIRQGVRQRLQFLCGQGIRQGVRQGFFSKEMRLKKSMRNSLGNSLVVI